MKLIHNHQSYTKFFKDMATYHKKLMHSDNAVHFARLNLSAHPMLAREDIKEFLKAMKNKLQFPALLLNTFSTAASAADSEDAKRNMIRGEFFIFDRVRKDDFDHQDEVFDLTEEIGQDIINFLGEFYSENEEQGFFIWSEESTEKISNLEFDNLAGTKFYFTIDVPNEVKFQLNEDAFDPELFEL